MKRTLIRVDAGSPLAPATRAMVCRRWDMHIYGDEDESKHVALVGAIGVAHGHWQDKKSLGDGAGDQHVSALIPKDKTYQKWILYAYDY